MKEEKYNEKFTVPDDVNYRKLSSWTAFDLKAEGRENI